MEHVKRLVLVALLLLSLITACARTRKARLPTDVDGSTVTVEAAIAAATGTVTAIEDITRLRETGTPTSRTAASPTGTPILGRSTPTAAAPPVTKATSAVPPTQTSTTPAPAPQNWEPDGRTKDEEYSGRAEVGPVIFLWSHDATYLYGAMMARTTGWVAVGFAPEEQMKGANVILGYVSQGEVIVEDMFGLEATGPGSHPADETLGGSSDIVSSGGYELDGITVIEFKIPLDSGDAYDKVLVPGTRYKLIAAASDQDDPTSADVSRDTGEFELK